MEETKIKNFRVWDRQEKKWFESENRYHEGVLSQLFLNMSGELVWRSVNDFAHESTFPERFVVSEYTGWLNEHGEPIYEGDFLASCDFIDGKWTVSFLPVFWNSRLGWCVDISYKKDRTVSEQVRENLSLRVLGNLFEGAPKIKFVRDE